MSAGLIDEAKAFLGHWAAMFNTQIPERLVPLYAEDGTLHGTSQAKLNHGTAQIRAYFRGTSTVAFGTYLAEALSDDTVLCVGNYTFTRVQDGQTITTPARFTFVVWRRADGWRVVHHHSSREPG
jgi:hypothetical protein